MSLKSNFELMAHYNQWMNESIYGAASSLSLMELNENRGAFFGSIIATLNHVLVGDIVWLKRFANHQSQFKSLDFVRALQSPKALDAILYIDFDRLLHARTKMDSDILEFTNELTEEILLSSLSYSNTKGLPFTQRLGYLIQHFFNHQTHHRGQISTLISQVGIDVGITDLLASIPDEQRSQ